MNAATRTASDTRLRRLGRFARVAGCGRVALLAPVALLGLTAAPIAVAQVRLPAVARPVLAAAPSAYPTSLVFFLGTASGDVFGVTGAQAGVLDALARAKRLEFRTAPSETYTHTLKQCSLLSSSAKPKV